jgi:signal transduction histidine kinase
MSTREDEPLLVYQRGRDLLDQQFPQARGPQHQATAFARILRALWPEATLCYCRLGEGAACALDDGKDNAAWARALEEPLARWLEFPEKDASETLPSPDVLGLPSPLLVSRIQGVPGGAAAVAFRDQSAATQFWAAEVLNELCDYFGLRLLLDSQKRREYTLLEERERQTALCVLADMVGPVSHDMQGVFNNLVLQAALVSLRVPAEVRPDVDVMRRLTLEASDMMGRLDKYRYTLGVLRRPVAVNEVVSSLLAELPEHAVPVRQELGPELPPASANESDLRRLLSLLVANARAVVAAQGSGTVTVRTTAQQGKVLLVVEDDGPGLGKEDHWKVFEPFALAREGENSLELAACHGLVRKLGGRISASGGDRGLVITVELDEAGVISGDH